MIDLKNAMALASEPAQGVASADRAASPPGGLSADRARLLVKAMLDYADKLRTETHRGGLTDGSDDAYPNGYEQAAKDLARAAGIEAADASPTAQPCMVEVSGPAGDPVWTDPRVDDFNARAALAALDPKGGGPDDRRA